MHGTAARVELVIRRARERARRREKKELRALGALCLALSAALICAMGAAGGPEAAAVYGASGAMLLYEDAGGYVLVGLASFSAAVLITVLCIRSRDKSRKRGKTKEEKEL